MIYLLCYDIENDKLRTRLSRWLEKEGLDRIQYSVFAGSFDTAKWAQVWRSLEKKFGAGLQPADTIYSFALSRNAFDKSYKLGPPPDSDMITGRAITLYID